MARPTHILAIDGGGSKTAAALFTADGEERARWRGGPSNVYQDPAGGIAVIRTAWQELAAGAGPDPRAEESETTIAAGLAGIGAGPALDRLDHAFAGFAACRWSSDGYTALIGAFGGGPGALLSVGTGVVGCRLDRLGQFAQLGGWGFPAGDRGGGAWLGLRLVNDHLEERDGYGPVDGSPDLWPRVAAVIGTERAAILDWLRTARPADFAALARLVVRAGEAGDAYVQALLDEATGHLLRLARALGPGRERPLSLGGGLAETFRARLVDALGPGTVTAERDPDALRGAFQIGIGAVPPQFP
jgi:glucosamine kinase